MFKFPILTNGNIKLFIEFSSSNFKFKNLLNCSQFSPLRLQIMLEASKTSQSYGQSYGQGPKVMCCTTLTFQLSLFKIYCSLAKPGRRAGEAGRAVGGVPGDNYKYEL